MFTLLAIPAAAQVPSYVPTDGLVGWWPFCGNANDGSGNGHDGNVFETALTQDRFGNSESAYAFDGVNDYIQVPHHPDLNSLPFSISFWLKADVQMGEAKIFNKVCCSSWNGWDININGVTGDIATMHFEYYNSTCQGIYQTYCSPVPYPQLLTHDDTWHHMVFSVDSLQAKVYLDGVVVLTQGWDGTPTSPVTSVALDIGRYGFGNNYFYQGLLDDIGIWSHALTEAEVLALFNSQEGGCAIIDCPQTCTTLPSNLEQGLVGYWPFCGNANDESGNGNDGVVNGATLTEDRFGNANAAYGFDGTGVSITSSLSNPISSLSSNGLTMSCWINNDFYGNEVFLNVANSNEDGGYAIWNSPSYGLTFGAGYYGQNPTLYNEALTPSQNPNQWSHVCAVFNFETSELSSYINGELASYVTGNSITDPVLNILIGTSLQDLNWNRNGKIDDIGIWNRALTPEEVQELYTLDACTFTVYDTLTVYETVYDTVYTYETIYDTLTTYVTVTDTLLIDITLTGFEGQPSELNTITVFPNPASDHITIDYGNFALMAGYNTIITDAAGATVYSSAVNSQQVEIDINAWGAMGVYYMSVYDASGQLVAVRHIVLE